MHVTQKFCPHKFNRLENNIKNIIKNTLLDQINIKK